MPQLHGFVAIAQYQAVTIYSLDLADPFAIIDASFCYLKSTYVKGVKMVDIREEYLIC